MFNPNPNPGLEGKGRVWVWVHPNPGTRLRTPSSPPFKPGRRHSTRTRNPSPFRRSLGFMFNPKPNPGRSWAKPKRGSLTPGLSPTPTPGEGCGGPGFLAHTLLLRGPPRRATCCSNRTLEVRHVTIAQCWRRPGKTLSRCITKKVLLSFNRHASVHGSNNSQAAASSHALL